MKENEKKRHPRENSKVKTISDQKEHKASSSGKIFPGLMRQKLNFSGVKIRTVM